MGIMTALVVLIIISEIVSYFIYRGGSFKDLRKFYDTLLKRKTEFGDMETFTIRYAEHPFLGFSLNPDFRNSLGVKIHNKYGFRCNDDFEKIDRQAIVYCAGGSSTYCNYMEQNEDTWPNVLERELRATSKDDRIKVVNGACSGWTSYQSLIRFSSWVDILKPKLVIVYHGKNDFAPFVSGSISEREVFPDYGNVIHSLQLDAVSKKLPLLARAGYTGKVLYGAYVNHKYANILWHIYGLKRSLTTEEAERGLKRVGPREWEFIISRYRSFAALCAARRIPIVFVIQKVISDLYKPYMEEINKRLKALESRHEGCFVYDFDKDIGDQPGILYDHVHFTPYGAKVCAEKIKDFIVNNVRL